MAHDSHETPCLLIGASGFLGRALHAALRREGASVIVAGRGELDSLKGAFGTIYLLAAHIPYGRMDQPSPELVAANVALPLEVARRWPGARLVHASTVSVYGAPLALPVDEEHPFNRPNAYALSKLAGEVAVQAVPDHVILRFSSIYGPGMRAETFIPRILHAARATGWITLHGEGTRLQDYLFVEDAAQMLLQAGRGQARGTFNAVHGASHANREVAEAVAAAAGGVQIRHEGHDPLPSARYARQRWDQAFGPPVLTGLREGIRRMATDAR